MTNKFCWVGGSWAIKGFTESNYQDRTMPPSVDDVRLPDFWNIPYDMCCQYGKSTLDLMDIVVSKKLDPSTPLIWIYVEPGRDYGRITGRPEHEWMTREDIFEIRKDLDQTILTTLRNTIPNPIALIGGDTDITCPLAEDLGFYVLSASWQRWIAERLNSQWFKFGWNAADIGWRMHSDGITPGRAATFAWDDLIKEWCWWEEQGYFCHEHPTPLAHEQFAEYLKPKVNEWLNQIS